MTDEKSDRVPPKILTDNAAMSTNIDNAFRRMLRKKNPAQLKKMNDHATKQENSLSKFDIMQITMRALEDQKNRRNIKPEIFSTIKGKPYCLKLGEMDPSVDNFKGFYDTFYTNIYRDDKDKPRISLSRMPPPTPSTISRNSSHNRHRTDDKQNLRQKSLASSHTSKMTSSSVQSDSRRYFHDNFTNFINDCSELLQSNTNKRRSLVKYPTVNPFKGRF